MSVRHLISSQDFSKTDYDEILRRFQKFISGGISPDLCRGKIVATLFFQPSTRTMNCFQSGMLRAGGGWIGVMGEEGLSMEKGESFEETIHEYSSFSDCIVIRHPDDDSAERAVSAASVPIINAGCGSREHAVAPAMLLCVLAKYLRRPLEGARVGLYGTPEINRVSKAMLPIFGYYGMDVVVDDLGHFPFPKEIEEKAKANGLKNLSYGKIDDFLGEIDVLLVTRGLQKGIISPDKFPPEKETMILNLYKPVNREHMARMRNDAILVMIKPRIFEIEREVDSDHRAIYMQPEYYSECALSVMTYLLGIDV